MIDLYVVKGTVSSAPVLGTPGFLRVILGEFLPSLALGDLPFLALVLVFLSAVFLKDETWVSSYEIGKAKPSSTKECRACQ